MAEVIKARVWWKVGTETEWMNNPLILGAGEPAWVVTDDGKGVNVKVGTGDKTFSDLNYFVSSGGQYVPLTGKALPTPTLDDAYTIATEGVYTHASGNITVPTGKIAVLVWSANAWSLGNTSDVISGRGIASITKTGTVGNVDTYTITYTDAATSTYTVTNGIDGTNAQSFNFKGNVANYAGLPNSGNVQNDAWYNLEDGLLYVFNGSVFPLQGEGMNLFVIGGTIELTELSGYNPTIDGLSLKTVSGGTLIWE